MGFSLAQLQAQTSAAAGDLILFFQKPGDTNTVYANLGNAALLFRGAEAGPSAAQQRLNIININSTLVNAFGATWATDPDIYAGLAGARSNSTALTVVNGDQNRTLYVSRARPSVGTVGQADATPWDLVQAGSLTTGATNMVALTNNFNVRLPNLDQGVLDTETSTIDNMNPTTIGGFQSAAFDLFVGGVQQSGSATAFGVFGAAGQVEFALDLQRLVPDGTVQTNEVAGQSRFGSYEGTVTIGTDGNVSFITQGTASPFQTWALTFSALNTEAKRLPAADPDHDGLTNLVEFVLNGNPGAADGGSVSPTLNASGSNFVFSFSRRDDAVAGNTLTFEYGENLATWTSVPIGATGSTVGSATVGIVTSSNPDVVTVTVPKSVSSTGKLFGRIKVTQP